MLVSSGSSWYYPHYAMGKAMGKTLHKLSDAYAKSGNLKPGRHSDGGGLYLNVSPTGTKSWLFMWSRMVTRADGTRAQRRHEMGLGAYPLVTLAEARNMASDHRKTVAGGGNPIAERKRADEPTFAEATAMYISEKGKEWRNEKHRAQWRTTLDSYCAAINDKRVSAIGTDDVKAVLNPIWGDKPETASRVRGRIERVLDFCKTNGWRTGDNPAMWLGHLKNIMPKKPQGGHHAAMHYRDVPGFMVRLSGSEAMAARCLEITILCASRTGEAIGAQWSEIDLEAGIWTIPAARMKADEEHAVPLSRQARAILAKLQSTGDGGYVFPGERAGRPLSNMAMAMLLKRMNVPVTVHGFRSSFRDWTGDNTAFPREIAEAALAHGVRDKTEAAYRRMNALEWRRQLMQIWADYLDGANEGQGGKVIAFTR